MISYDILISYIMLESLDEFQNVTLDSYMSCACLKKMKRNIQRLYHWIC